MALLEFSGLRFGYSDEIVIVEAAGALQPGNVIGLVGANGGGKTTLLRLLIGELNPDSGNLQRARSTKVAHVAQAASGDMATPLYDYVQGGRPELIELEHQIARLSEELSRPQPGPDNEAQAAAHELLLERLGRAQQELEDRGGHGWEHLVERLLLGLAFSPAQFHQPIGQLSGGQLQKGRLARQLLSDANCLILDEPTNHLDLDSQAFLVDWLRALTGRGGGAGLPAARGDCGVLLVSHDRWLLDALCDHIWELDNGVLYRYPGNYNKYLPQREARRKLAREQYETQREQIARTEEYIRRNIAGQNTRQAQGRRTHLQRMERLEAPASDPAMSFILKPALRTGEQVLVVEDLAFAYERRPEPGSPFGADTDGEASDNSPASHAPRPQSEQSASEAEVGRPGGTSAGNGTQDPGPSVRGTISLNPSLDYVRSGRTKSGRLAIAELNFQVMRGERLGIVGPNGCGKTTLLKLITRMLAPRHGMIAWGSNVELGVFSQDSADLGSGLNLISELRSADPLITDSAAREYLARFGFSGEDVMKDVAGLSGGERSRLSLAKLFRRRPNVLVFDEPTNHLDIYAREAIEQFLDSYEGTIIMVTHDRALLERLCDRLLVFEAVGAGRRPAHDEDDRDGAERVSDPPLQDAPGFSQVYFRGHYSEYLRWKEQKSILAGPGLVPGQSTNQEDGRGQASALQDRTSCAAMPGREQQLAGRHARPTSGAGLPSPQQLTELARAERCSPQQYCRKQLQRLEKIGMEIEAQIESGEEQISAVEQQQREADARGEFTQIARLQDQIDVLRRQLDGQYGELERNMSQIEAWAELEFVAGTM